MMPVRGCNRPGGALTFCSSPVQRGPVMPVNILVIWVAAPCPQNLIHQVVVSQRHSFVELCHAAHFRKVPGKRAIVI